MNSRRKGKRGELEAAKVLRELGLGRVTRAAQHSGKEQADLRGVPGVHVEVKRRQRIAAVDFLDQAIHEAGDHETPMVLMREDHGEWVVQVRLRDLEQLAIRWLRAIKGEA